MLVGLLFYSLKILKFRSKPITSNYFFPCFLGIACGYTSPLEGIGRYTKTIHELGCANVACTNDKQFGRAINVAQQADATVLVMGLDQSIEAETVDRAGLLLPGRQQDLVSKVAAASKGPTILVIMSGGPVDITFAKNDPRIQGILWAGYPGQAGGAAIADILFGTSNPGLSSFGLKLAALPKIVYGTPLHSTKCNGFRKQFLEV